MKIVVLVSIIFTILMMSGFLTAADVETTRNTLKEIEAKKGKIVLTQVRAWGDEDSSDSEEMYFKSPAAVKHGVAARQPCGVFGFLRRQ